MADIKAKGMINEISDDLIINWDQTSIHIVSTGNWTMHPSGEKVIPIANLDDKRQITVLATSIKGQYLSPQSIYTGKTTGCHPKTVPLNGWDVWHSDNHWSNQETMKRYIKNNHSLCKCKKEQT